MRQSPHLQKSLNPDIMPARLTQSYRVTPVNVLLGFVVLLIVMFLVMSLVGIGPFSWSN